MNHNTKSVIVQKSFADIPLEDRTPAPLAASQKFGFPLQHYEPTEDNQEYLYSIHDWIAGVTQSKNPTQVWADLKRRYNPEKLKPNSKIGKEDAKQFLELLESVQQLPYTASNGKSYKMDFGRDTILFLIVQFIEADTNAKLAISSYIAEVAHIFEDWKLHPEKMLSAAQSRMLSDIERHEKAGLGNRPEILLLKAKLEATETLSELKKSINKLLIMTKEDWAKFHSVEIKALLGLTMKQIRDARNIKGSVRDSLNMFEYNSLVYAERQLMSLLSLQGRVDEQRLLDSVQSVFTPIGKNLRELLENIGIDVLTGKYQLPGGKGAK